MIEYYVTCVSKLGKVYQCKHYAFTEEEMEARRLRALARREEEKRRKAIEEILPGYTRLRHASEKEIMESIEEYNKNVRDFDY